MTEDGTGEAPLTPEEEAEVARLLGEAGGPVRMPDDVATRLTGVLAELQGERAQGSGAEVVELRARRRWPRLLLAAAAVVVGGYAVGTVATQGTLSGSEDALSAGDAGGAQEDASGGETSLGKDRGRLSAPEEAGEQSTTDTVRGILRLRSDRLDVDVRRALEVLESRPSTAMSREHEADGTCPAPPSSRGAQLLPVRYDGDAAVLVVGRERRGTVEVTIWSCTGDELDRTVVRP